MLETRILVGSDHSINQYTMSGILVAADFIHPGISYAVAGPYLLVASNPGIFPASSITEYLLNGQLITTNFITGFANVGPMVVSGTNLYIPDYQRGTIAKYTTAGVLIDANFITGLTQPQGLTISGSHLYVSNGAFTSAWIGEYNADTGAAINTHLITNLNGAYGLGDPGE